MFNPQPKPTKKVKQCKTGDCLNPLFSHGYCKYHWNREQGRKNIFENNKMIAKMKSPKDSMKKLIKTLDTVFSLFIRLRNASKDGMVVCYTSGKIMHYKQSQCGHFVSRRHKSTRWDEKNCQVQSVGQNIFCQGNAPQFAINLDKQYGKGTAEYLVLKSKMPCKLSAFEIKLLIEEYEYKVNYLKQIKPCE